jgi:phenylacetate-CoA ligase
MYEPIKRHLILSSDHMEARFMPEYVNALKEWKPTFIHAFPSALYPLAKWLNAHPEPEITSRIHGVELTSENTYDHQLVMFRRVFHCPVTRGYGHTERALLAATMPDDDRYFFWPLYGYPELIDARGNTIVDPGVLGEIVGTTFDNAVMPFVRYRTGDMGAWGSTQHPSLPGFPVFERIEGRMQDFVVCQDRRVVSVTTLGAAHFSDLAEVETIQYEQSVPGRLTLRVVSKHEIQEGRRTAIADAVKAKSQGGLVVEVVRVPQIERTSRGKARMLIQHLDLGEYFGGTGTDALHAQRY